MGRLHELSKLPKDLWDATERAICGLTGGLATPIAGLTLGYFEIVNDVTNFTWDSRWVFPIIYQRVIKVINPKAEFETKSYGYARFWPYDDLLPFFTGCITTPIRDTSIDSSHSPYNNFLERHVISRAAYALLGPAAIITGIADGILAIPTTALALITFGRFAEINTIARNQLHFPVALHYLGVSLRGVVNPQSIPSYY